VAEGVVYLLEVVEVQQQQRAIRPVAAPVGDVPVELLLEAAPVEQPRERIVVGRVAQPCLGCPALEIEPASLGPAR
jgi:hypothetical protein